MTLDTSNRKSVRAAEKAAEHAERQRGEVVIALASTEAGRKYIWDGLEASHLFTMPYPSDPHMAYFILGQRNQGQQLLDDILHWCPDQFLQMTREANGRRTRSDPSSRDAGQRASDSNGDGRDQGSADGAASGFGESGDGEDSGSEASLN